MATPASDKLTTMDSDLLHKTELELALRVELHQLGDVGAGVARELAAQGAKVLLAARTLVPDPDLKWGEDGPAVPGSLAETIDAIRSKGGTAEAYQIDLSDTDAIRDMVDDCVARWGQIDILANCAMGFPDSYAGSLWTTGPEDWASQFDMQLEALESGEDVSAVRKMMDEIARTLNVALRERASTIT